MPLTLNDSDPRVVAARESEQQLFEHYGLQATQHYVPLPDQGIRVRVLEIGTGKPIVIVPGNTGDAFPLASLLATFKGRRIIAINRPGGGLSEGMDHNSVDIRPFAVATLHTVLQAFNLEAVDIVAHSMGAHWSLWLAMDRPHLVRSLTLLGNPGNVLPGRPPLVLKLMSRRPLNKLIFRLLMASKKDRALQSLKFMGHSEVTLARLPTSLGDCFYYFRHLPHYRTSAISLMENTAPKIDEGQLSKLAQPTLFLLGTKDNFASIATGQRIAAALPDCSFYPITDAGHLPWLEDPEHCGRLIMDFLTKMTIISSTPADIPALVALVNAAYRGEGQPEDSQKGWTSEGHLIKGARTNAEGIKELLQSPHSIILKYLDEKGELTGCVHLEKQEDKLSLGLLSVSPERQGQGIGKYMLTAAANYAAKNNCLNIHITVISARPELIAWYERHGYQRTGETIPFHHGEKFGIQKQPLELVVLEKPV